MRIPFSKTRKFSTFELPGVVTDPPLEFEIITAPTVEQVKALTDWLKGGKIDKQAAISIGAAFLKSVSYDNEDGGQTTQELGTEALILEMVDQTGIDFLGSVLHGWNTRIALERMTQLKKQNPLLGAYFDKEPAPTPARES